MRAAVKRILGELFEKSGAPIVAVFVADAGEASRRMVEQLRETVPGYPLAVIAPEGTDRRAFPDGVEWIEADGALPYAAVRRALARRWVGLAAFLLDGDDRWRRLGWALLTAPRRVLAFHPGGESHPLRLEWPLASWRFLRGERLGDLFRPTSFRWLRDLVRWIPALALFGGWVFFRMRASRASPELAPPVDQGFTVIHLRKNDPGAELDNAVRLARAAEIIVTTGVRDLAGDAIAGLRSYLRKPGVWLVAGSAPRRYQFADGAVPTRARESGTYCLGAPSSLMAFRRDVYLQAGGLETREGNPPGHALAAMCLRALFRGWKTVYAGEIGDPIARPAPAQEVGPLETRLAELLLAGVDRARPALGALHHHAPDASFRRCFWRAARKTRPIAAGGNSSGELLPLVRPRAISYRGREAGRRPAIGVLTPYFPYPLSHGGAIRIYNLLRHAAEEFDLHLFAFAENETHGDIGAMLEYCSRVVLVKPPVWEVPRWVTATPKGIRRYRVEQMRSYIEEYAKDFELALLQIEFTQLAFFGRWLRLAAPKVLVEHDITFDLHRQAAAGCEGWNRVAARAEAWRWRRYEVSAIQHFDRVITMSNGDRSLLAANGVPESKLAVVENGIDLERFQATKLDAPEARLLFIGSFRHFPNIRAYRLLVDDIWPRIAGQRPDAKLTVVAGPDPELYWRKYFGTAMPAAPGAVELRAFVADVRPLYETSQVVAAPVPLSAGTNIKVLEALAMGRPVVSTTVGCAGLDLQNGRSVLVADDAATFADAVLRLFADQDLRRDISQAGRSHVVERFGWEALGRKQLDVWERLIEAKSR